jgi:hypothetical protein
VHYSSDFASRGYDGASHGCVNVRDYDELASLFAQVDTGTRVVVYRSWSAHPEAVTIRVRPSSPRGSRAPWWRLG